MTAKSKALAIPDGYAGYDSERINLIKQNFAKKATNDELRLFLTYASMRGLDPISRQIVFTKYDTKRGPQIAFITTIDGYRLVADRTGRYAGSDDYLFDNGLSMFNHMNKLSELGMIGAEAIPLTATVTVYKIVQGVRVPFTASARWSEYYPGKGPKSFMWDKMPYLMIGKCTEALALRKAFPLELSGMYTDTEMHQAGVDLIDQGTDPFKEQAHQFPVEPRNAAALDVGAKEHAPFDHDGTEKQTIIDDEPTYEDVEREMEVGEAEPENERPYDNMVTFNMQMATLLKKLGKKELVIMEEDRNIRCVAAMEYAIKATLKSMGYKKPDDMKVGEWITQWRYAVTEALFGSRSSKDLTDAQVQAVMSWLQYEKVLNKWTVSGYGQAEMNMVITYLIEEK